MAVRLDGSVRSSPARWRPTRSTCRTSSRPSSRPGPGVRRLERGDHRPRRGDRQRSRPAPLGHDARAGAACGSTTWPPACSSGPAGSRPRSAADLYKGTVKGRLTLSTSGNGLADFKSQGTFDDVRWRPSSPPSASRAGSPAWPRASSARGAGHDPPIWSGRPHGRLADRSGEGELIGIGLNDALRRVEKRPLLASLDWKGGRTPFDQATVRLNIGGRRRRDRRGRMRRPRHRPSGRGSRSSTAP